MGGQCLGTSFLQLEVVQGRSGDSSSAALPRPPKPASAVECRLPVGVKYTKSASGWGSFAENFLACSGDRGMSPPSRQPCYLPGDQASTSRVWSLCEVYK